MKNKTEKREIGNIVVILGLTVIIMLASWLLFKLGFDGGKTTIVNGVLETSLVTVNNIFTKEGLQFIFGNFITNVKLFEPLIYLVLVLICAGIIEKSKILKYISKFFRKINSKTMTFLIILLSICMVFLGEYSYLILFAIIPLLYKELKRNPILGLLTVFLGISLGYGAGIIFSYNDYVLGNLTEMAARVDVDKNFNFNIMSNIYIMITSTIVITFILTYLIENKISKRLPKYIKEEINEVEATQEIELVDKSQKEKKAFIISSIVALVISLIFIYILIPGSFGFQLLLDVDEPSYIAKLFSDISPFKEGIFLFLLIGISITCFIYGKFTDNFKNSKDFSVSFAKQISDFGVLFVLIFFISQLIAVLNWTNITEVVTVNLIDFISRLEFSGLALIFTLFIITILIGILIPSTILKWSLMAPLIIPLFMRSNITPEFAQFIFKAGDGVSKTLTIIFPYYVILLGFIQKYNNDNHISVFGTIRLLFPTILIMIGLWIVILFSFYVIGLPIGPGVYPTL